MVELCMTSEDHKTLKKWMYDTPYEMVAEIEVNHISPTEVLLELKDVLSYRDDTNDGCTPTDIEIRPLMLHTHPKFCYKHQGIKFAWPSSIDITSLLDHCLYHHFVVSLEGIYVIDCKPMAHKKWKTLSPKEQRAISRQHDVPGDLHDVDYFLNKINNLGWVTIKLIKNYKII